MKPAKQQGQGALEYLLLIGGAVVVAVVVIFIMIGLAGSSGNAANQITTNALAHISGVLPGGGNGGGEVELCGDGTTDESKGEECDCGNKLKLCTQLCPTPSTGNITCENCSITAENC